MRPCDLPSILELPFQQRRKAIAELFLNSNLNFDQAIEQIDLLRSLVAAEKPSELENFEDQVLLVLSFMEKGSANQRIDLSTPEHELLWGISLAAAFTDEKISAVWPEEAKNQPFRLLPIGSQLLGTDLYSRELGIAQLEAASLIKARVQINWAIPHEGYPGLAYAYNSHLDRIHLDPVWHLIIGSENAIGAVAHEIAHGIGTRSFTPKLQKLHDQLEVMQKKPRKDWGEDDYIAFTRVNAEWYVRFLIFDEAENNYANRFAANRTSMMATNYSTALNYIESLLVSSEHEPPPVYEIDEADKPKEEVKAEVPPEYAKYLRNIKRVIRYNFFKNNGLIEDTEVGWKSVNVDIDFLYSGRSEKTEVFGSGEAILENVLHTCHELEKTQPQQRERLFLSPEAMQQRADECSEARNIIIDELFDRHLSHILSELDRDAENEAKELLERAAAEGINIAETQPSIFIPGLGRISVCDLPPEKPEDLRVPSDGMGEECEGEGYDGKAESNIDPEIWKEDKPSFGGGGRGPGGGYSDATPKLRESTGDGSWYNAVVAKYSGAATEVARMLRAIEERVIILQDDEVDRYSLYPEDGNPSRIDTGTIYNRMIKLQTGQPIDENTISHFKIDLPVSPACPPSDIVIAVDGSGSMRGEPVETAMSAGCIVHAGAQMRDRRVNLIMMGEPKPLEVAKPGDSPSEIARRIEALKKGDGGSRDFLSPVVKLALEFTINQRRITNELQGKTSLFCISDGGFSDGQRALQSMTEIAKLCPGFSLDFIFIVKNYEPTGVIKHIHALNRSPSKTKIGYVTAKKLSDIPGALVKLLDSRLKASGESEAQPYSLKRSQFMRAHSRMNWSF